jgi:hypothetical protein
MGKAPRVPRPSHEGTRDATWHETTSEKVVVLAARFICHPAIKGPGRC